MEFSILYWLQGIHNPWLDQLMAAITFLGNAGWFWAAAGTILFCIKKTRPAGLAVLLSITAGFFIGNCFLKPIFHRQRPCWIDQSIALLIPNPGDYSFPSGHTLASFEASVSIFLCHKKWGLAALTLAFLIAFSRLYLFVHFPTDVLAGALLGTFIAVIIHRLIGRYTAWHPHAPLRGRHE